MALHVDISGFFEHLSATPLCPCKEQPTMCCATFVKVLLAPTNMTESKKYRNNELKDLKLMYITEQD